MPVVNSTEGVRTYLHTLSRQELQWLQRSLTCPVDGPANRRVTLIAAVMRYVEHQGLRLVDIRALVQHGESLGYPRRAPTV